MYHTVTFCDDPAAVLFWFCSKAKQNVSTCLKRTTVEKIREDTGQGEEIHSVVVTFTIERQELHVNIRVWTSWVHRVCVWTSWVHRVRVWTSWVHRVRVWTSWVHRVRQRRVSSYNWPVSCYLAHRLAITSMRQRNRIHTKRITSARRVPAFVTPMVLLGFFVGSDHPM
jgi:hypothetical protein